ncbi:MAG: beta-ketoacyl-ACP synthase III [Pseudomonadota bacterium]
MIRARPIAVGHYLPARIVPNREFEQMVDTSDEWIRQRTGIERRHFAAEGELTSDLAIAAVKDALKRFDIDPSSIDGILVATSTPDQTFPATATRVQAALGITQGFAFDLQAVCAGFAYALANADALIKAGSAKRIIVIGAETFSRILDFTDRRTCVLFGDGAGCLILEAIETEDEIAPGILATDLRADGRYNDILYVDGGVSSTQTVGVLKMEGQEVFKHAVTKLANAAFRVMEKAGMTSADISKVVPHQANLRIIKSVSQKLGLSMDDIVVTVQDHGNTSAASIPLALSVAEADGRIKKDDVILFEAIGGGLAWGAALVRW